MGVQYQHPDYDSWALIWNKCRDVILGQEAVHKGKELYLKRLANETDGAYEARIDRAVFFDATARTTEAMAGMLFRKPPKIESKTHEELLDNVDGKGTEASDFLYNATLDAMAVNRFGLLVDYPEIDPGAFGADSVVMEARPTVNLYSAESIVNWKTETHNGKEMLSKVVLLEHRKEPVDEFEDKDIKQYRVLDLFEGFYRVRVFETQEKQDVQIGSDVFPILGGNKQTEIPFYFYPAIPISKPVFLGLINQNLAHYKTTAGYEHGCHWSGHPTLFVSGYTPAEGEKIYIGGPTAQALPAPDAKAYYVEIQNNFEALRNNLSDKERRMAVLSSRMLEPQKKQTEATDTAEIHRAGEIASLSAMSIALANTFTKAFNKMIEWGGGSDDGVVVELNRDYLPTKMSPQLITSILQAVQAGKMSDEAFFEQMKQGEMYEDGVTWEEEQERIGAQPPPVPE